jgi:hypothetical protein
VIAAVILNHNKPENSDKLFEQLDGVFDRVELWDSGSDPYNIPKHLTDAFQNFYWAGCWNEIMRRFSDCDAVWMIGCDIELQGMAEEYLMCIRQSLPFGCWSPCVNGRAHPFMQAENYQHGKPVEVKNIEGMAMAVSGVLMRQVEQLMSGSKIGFGQDFWLCYRARQLGLKNIIDGRVAVYHPEGIGYSEQDAHDEMEEIFTAEYGADFRRRIFEYDERYEKNCVESQAKEERVETLTIVTADNGWTAEDFIRVTDGLPNVRRVILQKGSTTLSHLAKPGVEIIPYSEQGVNELTEMADIALFWKVGAGNVSEYKHLLEAGVPTIVDAAYSRDLIKHEENGFIFGNEEWCKIWLNELLSKPELREKVRSYRNQESTPKPEVELPPEPAPLREILTQSDAEKPMVTVITPTFKRDVKVVRRSINCLQLQNMQSWEQLICSNGIEEPEVRNLVNQIDDNRVGYHFCEAPQGDYGNYARKAMLNQARGKYVLFIDDDNIILPDFLSVMVSALEDSGADFAVCQVMHFGPLNEDEVGKPPIVLRGQPVKLFHIDPLQFLVRREVMQSIGWDTEHGYISDGYTLQQLSDRPGVEVPMVLGVHV